MARRLLPDKLEERLSDCIQRLEEDYLRNLERKKEAVLASEAASGGSSAELNKLEEQGIEVSIQLGEVFTQKARRGQEQPRCLGRMRRRRP